MAPHALNTGTQSGKSSVLNGSSSAFLVEKVGQEPFGRVVDPREIGNTTYTTPLTIIQQAIYSISSKIFSYESVVSKDFLDSNLQIWQLHYLRTNAFGVVPFFHKFEVRSGASNAILGFFGKNGTNGQPVSIIAGANALEYMQPSLNVKTASLPLALNISALDYNMKSGTLVSNYNKVLSVARSLNYPVLTPVDTNKGAEFQLLTILNHYIATVSGRPSINLFDGPDFSSTSSRFDNLLPLHQLADLYEELLSSTTEVTHDLEKLVEASLQKLNLLMGTNISLFEYSGSPNAETVFVVYGSQEAAQLSYVVEKLKDNNIGIIKIRLPLPFNSKKFVEKIPSNTKKLVILGQSDESIDFKSSPLKADITAALFLAGKYHQYIVDEFVYSSDFVWSPVTATKIVSEFVTSLNPEKVFEQKDQIISAQSITANTSPIGNYLIWGRDNSSFLQTAEKLALSLSLDNSKRISFRNKFDNSVNGGSFQVQISSSPNSEPAPTIDSADIVLVEDMLLIKSYDILATARPGATILLAIHKPIKNSIEEDLIPALPLNFKKGLSANQNKLIIIDLSIVDELDKANESTKGFSAEFLIQLAFWRASLPELNGYIVNKLLQANGAGFELLASVLDKFITSVDEKNGLRPVSVLPEWAQLSEEDEPVISGENEKSEENKADNEASDEDKKEETLPYFPFETSAFPNPRNTHAESEEIKHGGYKDIAKRFAFPEAYHVKEDLRPDLPVRNFVVKVQENKRLTPEEYSRNIFHIEFDISNTGLTYNIGEALGVHGCNNQENVEEFLKFYGVDGNSLVEVTSREDPLVYEIRSARQALKEVVDFLGKPPKRFYESLAQYASDAKQKEHLEKLASASGAAELKKRQEVDFATYVDILEEFTSARPPLTDLVKMIAPLKRREYSIASSQKIHPNAVHLLIVVVDWVDPKGRKRYGQCSKYLSDLKIGDELVVSVKPSIMKLPPLSTQPVIMSGLGTGLAPFKAFIEEKIWQKQQGMEIGEIYLFLGSRHKKEEYLYGELWEAYKDAGVLTHIGAAFSRDQPQKIYIQDKIRESINDLTDAFVTKNGSFYLCGPTWPVPDITACLQDIIVNAALKKGEEVKDLGKLIEDLKEDGRYVLEVY